LTRLNTVTAHGHVYNIFKVHFSLSNKMDSTTIADITQLFEITKSMGLLSLLEIFKQKQT